TALGVILAETLLPAERRSRATAFTAAFGLAVAFVWLVIGRETGTAMLLREDPAEATSAVLTGWRSDPFSLFVRGLAAFGGLLTVLLSVSYTRRMDRGHGEFYALLLMAILGVMLVSGVSDLLSLFICLELVTITSYILAALKRNDLSSTEAGLKYLVIGALSSAMLLFGIALVYGAVGEVSFDALKQAVAQADPSHLLLLTSGLVLLFIGILFKVGAVPFHVWIPDVYQGAPSPVTAFLSTGSKMAGVVLLIRLGEAVFLPAAESGAGLHATLWPWLIGVLAVVTLLFGILGAVPQRNLKRLFGYSSIGHAGYLLMGVAAIAAQGESGVGPGASAILFYLLAFFFTNLTAFTVIVLISRSTGGRHGGASYSGLWRRSPFLALAMGLALLSLAGVPPLSGFFGKFLILNAVVDKGLYWLAFFGALGVAVSLYFYFLWIRQIYMNDPDPALEAAPLRVGPWARAVLVVGIVGMLGMGIFMGPFFEWAEWAASSLGAPVGAVP
ncbi:MAG: NADH-quinone oxidoreductase subunit N, partial [Planctomycetota bacterium]